MSKQAPKEEPLEPPKLRKPPPPRYTPNITPLIDVLFLLLLFFVLTSKFRKEEGMIPGSLPPPQTEAISTSPPTILEIHGDDSDSMKAYYNFYGQPDFITDPEAVYRQLKVEFEALGPPKQAAEDGIVVIKYYNAARWKYVVDAYNQAASAGFKKISFQPAS